jgi:peptide/nickel transport system substrate-binding protein
MRKTRCRSCGREPQFSRRILIQGAAVAGAGVAGLPFTSRQLLAQDAAPAEPSGKIVIALSAEPDTLENWKAYSGDGHPVLRNVQEALLNRDPVTNELVGELATTWEPTDDVTWRFTLREGVVFHDGSPFNAEVAAFGINYTWSPENQFEIYQFIGPDMTATAVDEYTLDVTTTAPDPILPARLYFSPIPSMTQVQEAPDTLVAQPIGTGPYAFVAWNRGQNIQVTANPDWWGIGSPDAHGAVTIKDLEFVFRPESNVRAAMVTTGEAQIARHLSPEDCASTPVCLATASLETVFMRPDSMHPALQDERVRHAIAIAIDRQAIAEQLLGGGIPAAQLVGPSATGYDPDLAPYPYDMDQAKALVEEARAAGTDVAAPIKIITRQGNFLRSDELGEYIASQLRDIGLNAQSEIVEAAQFNEQAYEIAREDVPVDRGWILVSPHSNEMMDLSATAQSYYRCDGTASTYCDSDLDAALAEALPLSGDERAAALQGVTRILYDKFGLIPIIHLELNYGTAREIDWEPRLDAFMLGKEMSLRTD